MGLLETVRILFHLIDRKAHFMAKALIGHLSSDLRDPRLAAENARLRTRVAELQTLVLRLSEENDKLVASRAAELLDATTMPQMQPA